MSGWWRKKRRSNNPEFQESRNQADVEENVYGIIIHDATVASLAKSVLTLTATLAVFDIWQSFLIQSAEGSDSSALIRLFLYFSIPPYGYLAIKQKNQSLLGGFTFCTLCAAFLQIVTLVGLMMGTSLEDAKCEQQLMRLRAIHKPIAVQQAAEETCKHLHPDLMANIAAPIIVGSCLTAM
jgi:hypothetical protein